MNNSNSMEDSSFIKTLGSSPMTRVLDFLIEGKEFDYSLSDICRNADVGWTTLHTFWPQLEKNGIVKHTRISGKSKMHKINTENPVVRALIKFDFEISKYYGELELERQGHKVNEKKQKVKHPA